MALLASKSQYVPQPHSGSYFQSNQAQYSNSMFSQPSPTNSEFSEGQSLLDDIRSWDEKRVGEWLKSIGCPKYNNIFEKNNITGDVLLECDHTVLKELGVTKVGDRIRIFMAVKQLRAKVFGGGKKRNRDTLAALDNVGPSPIYKTSSVSPPNNHLTPQSLRRQSGRNVPSPGAPVLSNSVYTTESPTENDYPTPQRTGPTRISPAFEVPSDSSYNLPTGSSGTSVTKTPKTPYDEWQGSSPNPGAARVRHNQSSSLDAIYSNVIKVIGEDGQTRTIGIGGCNTREAAMKNILKKFRITDNPILWAIYIITKDANGQDIPRCLGDADLMNIIHDSSRPERNRMILRRRGSPPSPDSAEFRTAQQIARDEPNKVLNQVPANRINIDNPKLHSLTGEPQLRSASPRGISGGLSPTSVVPSPSSIRSRDSSRAASKKITAFFGQRPPSELISSNLAEYFPDHEHKALERTVRASMRRSARMSKYSRLSVATTRSISSIDSIPPVPTVGNIWLNSSPQSTMLPSIPMTSSRRTGPPSVRGSILMPETFNKDYLGPVPEDASPDQSDRKSYMSFESRNSVAEPASIVVTSTEGESTDATGYLDSHSGISTPTTEPDVQANYLNQLLNPVDSDEEGDSDDLDDDMDGLRWMKGSLIGSGSFGCVYLALNALTGELMAVKQVEMPTGARDDPKKQTMIDALSREIALLKDLQHPNIVQYLSSSKEDNCFNIFLEYIPGGSVAAMLNNYGPLKEPLIRNFVRQILTGLNYLHGKNIIHRDIKGANVLVDNKGGIKISDFGISKKVEAELWNSSAGANHRPSLQGSVFWMAPEVVKQTSYTLKADIWSLGCLVVEMFTGSHPYPDCSQLQAIFQIGTGGSAPQIPEKSTSQAKTFLKQTFELDHNKRPTADELLMSPFLLPLVGQGSGGD